MSSLFDLDSWEEIFQTLSKNKLRTALTAFGVGWGIFMLVIMLGSGNGLENAITGNFAHTAPNSFYIWSRATSMPFEGFRRGRSVQLSNGDVEMMRNNIEGVGIIAPRNQLGGYGTGNNVIHDGKTGAFDVMGDTPDFIKIKKLQISDGRWINPIDLEQKRKICVIGKKVKEVLFEEGQEPIGSFIEIQGINFRVVGSFNLESEGDRIDRELQTIYIPQTTFQSAFNAGDRVNWFALTPSEGYSASVVEANVITALKKKHSVHPDDKSALGHWSSEEEFNNVKGLFNGIAFVSWFVGICTLIAGVIGISNIMLVIVKERTKEIGIRRAIGAQPLNVITQIITESMVLTFFAGIIGLGIGVWLLEVVSANVVSDQFKQPGVDFSVAIFSLVVLIFSGCIAGILPAARAVGIPTVDALRAD